MLFLHTTRTAPRRDVTGGRSSTAAAGDRPGPAAHYGRAYARQKTRYQLCLVAADIVSTLCALLLAVYLFRHIVSADARIALLPHGVIFIVCWVAAAFGGHLYTLSVRHPLMRIFDAYASLFFGTLLAIAVTFLLDPGWLSSRVFYVLAYLIAPILYGLSRIIAAGLVADVLLKSRIAVLGTDNAARQVVRHLFSNGGLNTYDLVGVISCGGETAGDEDIAGVEDIEGLPVIAALEDCPQALMRHLVNTIVIAHSGPFSEEVTRRLAQCDAIGIHVLRFEAAYELLTRRAAIFNVGPDWLTSIETVRYNKYATRLKRVLDVATTVLLMPLAAIIIGICAILIKASSPGPVFYRHARVGRDGRHFTFAKLRTMIPDAEADTGPVWATENDPRVTRIGRILRMTRLDELPQLLHVLTGQMSLIGPRPERPVIAERLKQEIPLYETRLIVRPGITGWAQINHKYDSSTQDVIEKLRYDLYYIRNLSLGLDLQIILHTIGVVLGKKGAR